MMATADGGPIYFHTLKQQDAAIRSPHEGSHKVTRNAVHEDFAFRATQEDGSCPNTAKLIDSHSRRWHLHGAMDRLLCIRRK